ncbi:MAG: prepilin peptidase [Solirubrobacteraceae bacterium]|nr:prepilin peptidase [Solirubrobacteraceae bacterium]
MTPALVVTFAAAGGLVAGSLLNVVADRLPRRESLLASLPRCLSCGRRVRLRDSVPVLSWLLLRGRSRDCGAPIAARQAIVEVLTAALFAAVVLVLHGDVAATVLGLILVAFLIPLALIDLDHRILPNRLTAPAAVLAVMAGTVLDPGGQVERLIAGAAAGGTFLAIALAYPAGIGLGDVKLVGLLGLFLGREVAVAVLAALLLGIGVGAAIMARQGIAEGRKTAIPFGPFLAAGAVVALLVGPGLVQGYLDGFRG